LSKKGFYIFIHNSFIQERFLVFKKKGKGKMKRGNTAMSAS